MRALIESARKWLKVARKNWIKANKRIQVEYPLHHRYGVAPNALIRSSLSDVYRLDKELGKGRTGKRDSKLSCEANLSAEWLRRCACSWRSTRPSFLFLSPIRRASVNDFWLKTISDWQKPHRFALRLLPAGYAGLGQ